MLFNVNNYVRVKLTPVSLDILRRRHDSLRARLPTLPEFTPPAEDDGGWVRFQAWELMQIFGPHMGLGRVTPFETTVDIVFPPSSEAPSPQ